MVYSLREIHYAMELAQTGAISNFQVANHYIREIEQANIDSMEQLYRWAHPRIDELINRLTDLVAVEQQTDAPSYGSCGSFFLLIKSRFASFY
jgi:hypothetical protein